MRGVPPAGPILLLVCLSALASATHAVPLPHPGPQRRPMDAARLNRGCEACHIAIARQWRRSYHRLAYRDPAVTAALRAEPRTFCRTCHAPEAKPGQLPTGWVADAGVACVTCHVPGPGDTVLTGPGHGESLAPHAVVRSPRFGTDDACARCHEFDFPDGQARTRPELMQSTVSEHKRSPWRSRSCIFCHMPKVTGVRSHRFLGGHDPQLLRAALEVHATQPSPTSLRLRMIPRGVGHSFPTGDLFRRLEVRVESDGPEPNQVVAVRHLMRVFGGEQQIPGVFTQVMRRDDRLSGPVELEVPIGNATRPLRWRISYQRVLFPGLSGRTPERPQVRARLDGEIVLAEGTLR